MSALPAPPRASVATAAHHRSPPQGPSRRPVRHGITRLMASSIPPAAPLLAPRRRVVSLARRRSPRQAPRNDAVRSDPAAATASQGAAATSCAGAADAPEIAPAERVERRQSRESRVARMPRNVRAEYRRGIVVVVGQRRAPTRSGRERERQGRRRRSLLRGPRRKRTLPASVTALSPWNSPRRSARRGRRTPSVKRGVAALLLRLLRGRRLITLSLRWVPLSLRGIPGNPGVDGPRCPATAAGRRGSGQGEPPVVIHPRLLWVRRSVYSSSAGPAAAAAGGEGRGVEA